MLNIEDVRGVHTIEFDELDNGDIFEHQTDNGVCEYYMKIELVTAESKDDFNAIHLETGGLEYFNSYDCVMPIHEATLTIQG